MLLQPDAEENERLEQFWKLLYEICSARCWSQVQYVMLVPNLLAIVWHENRDIRSEGLTRAQHIFDAVFAAETLVYGTQQGETDASKRTVKEVERCLNDCAWNRLQLSREAFAVCRAAQFDHTDEQLRLLTHRLFARPATTKHMLEDSFGHMSDVAKRHMKGQTMQRLLGLSIIGDFRE